MATQFNHTDSPRAFRPIVLPANNAVTPVDRMAVYTERPAFVLKLDSDFPFHAGQFLVGDAIGESLFDPVNTHAEFSR